MPTLDVFDGNAFTMASLTEAINKLPHAPSIIGSLGLFSDRSIRTTTAYVEDRQGTLALISTAGRGSTEDVRSRPQRKVYPFAVPHVPYFSTIMADDILNIRQFGSETELESIASVVNDSLAEMVADHTATQEYHRSGAVQGVVKDADGSTIYDLFTKFDYTNVATDRTTVTFTFGTDNMKAKSQEVHRAMAAALGYTPYSRIIAFCGDQFFDSLVSDPTLEGAYDRWMNGEFLRTTQLGPDYPSASMDGFMFADIYWLNYRGKIGAVDFFPTDKASFVAQGVPGLFIEALAPADFVETVSTRGQRFYAKQRRIDFDKGIELHTQSNVLPLCTRPKSLIEGATG